MSLEKKQFLLDEVYSITALKDQSIAYGSNNQIKILDSADGLLIRTLGGHKGPVLSLVPLSDGRLASGNQLEIIIWDVTTGRIISNLSENRKSFVLADYDQNKIIYATSLHRLIVWDTKEKKIFEEIDSPFGHKDTVTALTKLEANEIASGSNDTTIKIWAVDCTDGRHLYKKTLSKHKSTIVSLVKLPGKKLASAASQDLYIIIWNLETYEPFMFLGYGQKISSLTLLSDGVSLASISNDLTIRLWDTWGMRIVKILKGHTDSTFQTCKGLKAESFCKNFPNISLALMEDGRLISGSADKSIIVWHNAKTKSKLVFL